LSDRITLLRRDAQEEASRFPALLARAEHLAGTVLLGDHGRRRSGVGDDFWQYRPLRAGDSVRSIDWRRSARGDDQYVREREWQIAQSVLLWVDTGASMRFSSGKDLPSKGDRARLVALAAAVLLIRGGERVGFTGWSLPPRGGDVQILRLAEALATDGAEDYSEPEARGMIPHARAMFVSDFLGNLDPVEAALTKAADRGVRGVLVQVLDPTEETFPFKGRTIFESVGGSVSHETLKAGDLRTRYLERLAERKARLAHLSRLTGWQYLCHHTSDSAQNALLWVYRAMDGGHG
jgi:uncharacterized protein (DUF58 family)